MNDRRRTRGAAGANLPPPRVVLWAMVRALVPERVRRARLLCVLGVCLTGAACTSMGGGHDGPAQQADPEARMVSPAFEPAIRSLADAVRAGDDDVARQILRTIRARGPDGRAAELADGYERVLDGRDLVRSLDLRLSVEPIEPSDDGAAPGHRFRLVLESSCVGEEPVQLQLPAGTLSRLRTLVDAGGSESRRLETVAVEEITRLRVPAGEVARVELLAYDLPTVGALAVRERWSMDLYSGQASAGGEDLPAASPPVAPFEHVRLAVFLPQAPVEPAELARYAGGEVVGTAALLERAVRIPDERREEALDVLAPLVERWAVEDPERVRNIAPALRWVARTGGPGAEPARWARWFATRAAQQEARDSIKPPLDLPVAAAPEPDRP